LFLGLFRDVIKYLALIITSIYFFILSLYIIMVLRESGRLVQGIF